jgi:Zn-dependent peptidase ImmA (M78 family)/transcriptional regulator with XRE-family HTH domain
MHELPTPVSIGRRVQLARDAKGLTQAELAHRLAITSHQSVSELEKGNRRLQPDELVKLADVLERDIEYFVDPFSLAGEAQYSWRRTPGVDDSAAADFSARADRTVGLLRWLRLQDEDAFDPLKKSLRLSDCSTFEDAQEAGERLARILKLGPVPAEKLLDKIEQDLDVPVLYVDMNAGRNKHSVSGATVHLADFTCILINRNEPKWRRAFDLAHELFHALTWETMRPEEVESNALEQRGTGKKDRIEQLADNFAAALLLPRALLEPKFTRTGTADREQLRALADYFGVSTAALAYRLFNLRWIDGATRDELKAMPLEGGNIERPKLFSAKFTALLAQALHEGRLSPRKAAKLLSFNLDKLAELFTQWGLAAPFES